MRYFLVITGLLLCQFQMATAQITQTVRGKVVDATSRFPLVGATVEFIEEGELQKGTVTDANGEFRLEEIPVGRRVFRVSYIGYRQKLFNNIIISSGKEVVLKVELVEESRDLGEITVSARRNGEVQNELATVSAREFSVDETNRYAGSRGDPARMASNFAGVQGADDSRNDIVIRGNSPQSVIWQVEGVVIPNPNHFAIPGTNGGPVSIINNKTLSNSDFFTGAFPAEFGNSNAGVFDLNLRNGNNQNHEFSGMFGLLGTELFAEGPINKDKGSSYLVNYRYSTISLFLKLGVDVGTNSSPTYQDATFRLSFPQDNGAELSLWGIGGLSNTAILISDQTEPVTELYGQSDRDQYFASDMGVLGMTYSYPMNKNTFWKTTLAASHQEVRAHHELIYDRDTFPDGSFDVSSVVMEDLMRYTFTENKYTASSFIYRKLDKGGVLKFGLMADLYDLHYHDSLRIRDDEYPNSQNWERRWNADDGGLLLQPYVHWKKQLTDRLSANIGLHSLYYSMNHSFSPLEPRAGMEYKMANGQRLSFGTGLHSQLQSQYLYFYYDPMSVSTEQNPEYNRDMDLSKSWHAVLGYDKILAKNMRLKMETYYQYLFNIPVDATRESSFSLLNTGSGFSRFFPDELENSGTGHNYGLEFTLERFFANNYFFMFTASVFESKYRGSDGVLRNTDFNGNYAVNGLATKEFKIGKSSLIGLGTKITWAGGRRYGIVDTTASFQAEEVIWKDEKRNEFRFPDYFRADLRITYNLNRPNVSHEVAFDLVNLFGIQNIMSLTWAPGVDPNNPIVRNYQLGFLPVFYYKIDF